MLTWENNRGAKTCVLIRTLGLWLCYHTTRCVLVKRISSNPSSPVLPYARRLGTSQPISPGGDAESPISTPQPGTPRPGTPLPGTPLPDASRRSARSSLLALVRGQSIQEDDVFVEEPTVEHLRRWLVKNPSKQVRIAPGASLRLWYYWMQGRRRGHRGHSPQFKKSKIN